MFSHFYAYFSTRNFAQALKNSLYSFNLFFGIMYPQEKHENFYDFGKIREFSEKITILITFKAEYQH